MFIDAVKETLNKEFNNSITENGALGYRTTGRALLDLNFRVASLRRTNESEIIDLFMKSLFEDKTLAIKWLWYASDIREGLGERRLFKVIIKHLALHHSWAITNLIQFIPEYQRWDYLFELFDTPLERKMLTIIQEQLNEDMNNMEQGKPISLLAKWMPSVNTSSKQTTALAKRVRHSLGMNEASYRKMLSRLRRHLDVVEVKMSSKAWGDINYETVPSRANLNYSNAFLRNDEARRECYLEALKKGKAKINSSVLFPHDIVHKYAPTHYCTKNTDPALEGMWKALPDMVNGNGNTIVVADGSASMVTPIGDTNVTALSVANALAIYFAERSEGEFKNKYITFSECPQLVDFGQCGSLREKIEVALRHNEVANTNIEAVFELILKTAISNSMEQSELPQNILIVSDMEFDSCVTANSQRSYGCNPPNVKLFDTIAANYTQHGYKLPRLVFWNVNSRTGTIPVIENDLGVALVSGFSVNIVKMVLSGNLDPYECLLEQLMSERYAKIVI